VERTTARVALPAAHGRVVERGIFRHGVCP
jgi:hypothetical protein